MLKRRPQNSQWENQRETKSPNLIGFVNIEILKKNFFNR